MFEMKRRYLVLEINRNGWTMFSNNGSSWYHNVNMLLRRVKPIETYMLAQDLICKLEIIALENNSDCKYFIVEV